MVVIPWAIISYYPIDIPHIKLLTQNNTFTFTTHFDKTCDRKALGYKPVKSHHIHRISLSLTLVLSSASDSCYNLYYTDLRINTSRYRESLTIIPMQVQHGSSFGRNCNIITVHYSIVHNIF